MKVTLAKAKSTQKAKAKSTLSVTKTVTTVTTVTTTKIAAKTSAKTSAKVSKAKAVTNKPGPSKTVKKTQPTKKMIPAGKNKTKPSGSKKLSLKIVINK